jgi:hypothetical protein
MQPVPKRQRNAVVNWSMPGQLIDQFPAAVVVVNGPPFRGPLTACRHRHPHWPQLLPPASRSPTAVLGYAEAEPMERITRRTRHRLTTAKREVPSLGGTNVVSR